MNCAAASILFAFFAVTASAQERDHHSYGNPDHVRVRHVALHLSVDFERHALKGTVTLTVERTSTDRAQPLVLDSRDLRIEKAAASSDGKEFLPTTFQLGKSDPLLGAPVT